MTPAEMMNIRQKLLDPSIDIEGHERWFVEIEWVNPFHDSGYFRIISMPNYETIPVIQLLKIKDINKIPDVPANKEGCLWVNVSDIKRISRFKYMFGNFFKIE